jgi:hypothetical protein
MREIDTQALDIEEQSRLIWMRVRDTANLLLDDNPKLHDVGSIIESIARYGWQDKPRYDAVLGRIKHGNGRLLGLYMMEKDGGYDPPRGVAIERETGAWCVQIDAGIDAATSQEAKAYALDANNLTLLGAEGITPWDVARMYEPGYTDLLSELLEQDELPVSVDEENAIMLFAELNWEAVSESGKVQPNSHGKIVMCPNCNHQFIPD